MAGNTITLAHAYVGALADGLYEMVPTDAPVPAALTLVEDVERFLFRRRAPRAADMAGPKAVQG